MATINVSLPSDGTTGDVADYNTPITTIVNEINGNLDNANIKSSAAIAGSKLADNSIDLEAKASSDSGWREVTDSWAYASATTITVPTDATTKYQSGDRIKITQSGTTKHFIIETVAATLLTVHGPDGDTVANVAISDIYYFKTVPQGMPTQGYEWWQELGRTTLGSTADTITVSSLPTRKYLRIYATLLASGALSPQIIFNNDSTAANYNRRISDNGSTDTGGANSALFISTGSATGNSYVYIDVLNIAGQNKILRSIAVTDAGDGVAPTRRDLTGQWENSTDAISRVDITNSDTGDFATGSEVVVLGHD